MRARQARQARQARTAMKVMSSCCAKIALAVAVFAGIVGAADAQRRPPAPPNYDAVYEPGPDSLVRRGVPKGKIDGPFKLPTEVFPGTEHDYWVYLPAQYDAKTGPKTGSENDSKTGSERDSTADSTSDSEDPKAGFSLMVFNDGATYMQPDGYYRAVNVLDNLIYRGEIPPMVAVFIDPGKFAASGMSNRSEEYNSVDDRYARVIVDELLPRLYEEYNISHDPERHGFAGWSSGAIAAFTVAWERPDAFRKVLNSIGTFVDLAGGNVYPEKILAVEKKPLRIFMIDGRNDNRGLSEDGKYDPTRDWFYQNVRLKNALVEKGYDVNYTWGIGTHAHDMGGAMLPEMMRWLWRDQPVSLDPHDTVERSFREAPKSE